MKKKCPICKSKKQVNIWNDKIRDGLKGYTNKKEKIFLCNNCNTRYRFSRTKEFLDNAHFRKIYDGEASVNKWLEFNKPREMRKFNKCLKYINIKNKNVLESNCGAGIILNSIKNKAKLTAGLDNIIYKKYVESKGSYFFTNVKEIIKKKIKFDYIISLGEFEHKYDPIKFLRKFDKVLKPSGKIVLRVPNFDNIYRFLLNNIFFKDDYRTSHNFYFNEKSLDFLFNKLNYKIIKKAGLQEYSINSLVSYLKYKKRPKNKIINFLKKSNDLQFQKSLEESHTSTSLLYIIKKSV